VRDRLRRIFDLIDPMPPVIALPVENELDRLELVPDPGTRDAEPTLCFQLGDLTLQLELGAVLTGMVAPSVAEVEVQWPEGATWAPVDAHGLFEVDDVPRGPVRLVIGDAATAWFVR
jgi:hypothetical protein